MLPWFKKRAAIRLEAAKLIEQHGNDAWGIAYAHARDMSLPEETRMQWFRICRVIGKLQGKRPHLDTATRYLD
jgi:L-fucose isomerase-like protein